MAMYDNNKTYKNPKIGQYGQTAAAGQKQSVAPPREGGMLQMAAAARARQPKQGAPPIPATKAFNAAQKPSGAQPGTTNTADPRQQAAQALGASMGMGGLQADTGSGAPAGLLQKPVGTETDMQGMGGGEAFPLPQADPAAPLPTGLEKDELPGAKPEGFVAGAGGDIGDEVEESDIPEGMAESGVPLDALKAKHGITEGTDALTGINPATGLVVEGGFSPAFDSGGKQTGHYDSQGNFYGLDGSPQDAPPEGTLDANASAAQNQKNQMTSEVTNYLNQATGIPEEELQGQIGQLMMASSEQMAKMAMSMAARGVGSGGLFGAGMGQIASQTVGAIANLRFENAKLGVEERMNKMKAFMSLQGQMMSEENRMKIFDEMSSLEREKFKYEQEQNAFADQWTVFNNMAALAQIVEDDAFSFALKNMMEDVVDSDGDGEPDRPMTAAEIMAHMNTEPGKDGVVTLSLKGGAFAPQAPEAYKEGSDPEMKYAEPGVQEKAAAEMHEQKQSEFLSSAGELMEGYEFTVDGVKQAYYDWMFKGGQAFGETLELSDDEALAIMKSVMGQGNWTGGSDI